VTSDFWAYVTFGIILGAVGSVLFVGWFL